MLGGLYERQSDVRLILAHAASLLPQQVGRIDYEAGRHAGGRAAVNVNPSDHLRLLYPDVGPICRPRCPRRSNSSDQSG